MKLLIIFLTIFFSFLAESILSWDIGGVPFPLTAAVAFFWFWRIELGARMILGAFCGLLFDALSSFSFGTYLAVFFFMAISVEVMRLFFSETKSTLTQGIASACLVFLFHAAVFAAAAFFAASSGHSFSWPLSAFPSLILGVLSWTILVSGGYFTGLALRDRLR